VELVLAKMKKHEDYWPKPTSAATDWPLFRYAEDFSQYVPRGHYTRSETLKRYFLGMMWFGRMTFILKGDRSYGPDDQPALVSVAEAKKQTLAAALLTKVLDQTTLSDKRKARDVWERIYAVTSFYVGLADDLGFAQYRAALAKICGTALDLSVLAKEQKFFALKVELAKHHPPGIYSGTGGQGTFDPDAGPEKLIQTLDKSAGFRFLGQRFIPDSYMMGKLVFPTVGKTERQGLFTLGEGKRVFPRGLDVMSILGSKRAAELIHQLGDDAYPAGPRALSYDQAVAALKKEYGTLTDLDWNRNLYWSWLHALKPLLAEYGKGYPTFMTTRAYRTKSLNTALASWAQLRHDTILYAKQSYTSNDESAPPKPKPVEGYVEPIPEFYGRLLALARMTRKGLIDMKVLDPAAKKRLAEFENLLDRLLALSEKELTNKALSKADYQFIRDFGDHLEKVIVAPNEAKIKALKARLAQAEKANDWKRYEEITQEMETEKNGAMKTTLIADVHTDQNTEKVLEEGTGYVDLGVFVYQQPDGQLVLGAGPVLSYYEFKQPMKDRLTDETWRKLLQGTEAPSQPEWTKGYRSAKASYLCRPRD
jgi:hypothetical protein